MNPRLGARVIAIGRVAFGAGLLIAPGRIGAGWLGDIAERGAMRHVLRGFGVRDVVIGMIAMHTVDNPQVGPRWQKTCAACDAVDAVGALMAARDLPLRGALGVALLGGGAAAAGLWCAGQLAAG
ncbi:MAG: hypothetical protein ACR2KV_10960 [Solirubrobacteraceae bacterium]